MPNGAACLQSKSVSAPRGAAAVASRRPSPPQRQLPRAVAPRQGPDRISRVGGRRGEGGICEVSGAGGFEACRDRLSIICALVVGGGRWEASRGGEECVRKVKYWCWQSQ